MEDMSTEMCAWEEEDGPPRGQGVSECAARVKNHTECGVYFAYAVGRCRCSPAVGRHAHCTNRDASPGTDIFKLTPNGTKLVHSGQRCVYTTKVDDEFFAKLRPVTNRWKLLQLWLRASVAWLVCGVPCGFVMLYVVGHLCCGCSYSDGDADGDSGNGKVSGPDMAYGPLIETGAVDESAADASDVVDKWIFRGAIGAIIYGLALLALGATMAMHMAGAITGFAWELVESLIMAISKAAVARAACNVHRRLTPIARGIAGRWVLVIAVTKSLMALASLGATMVFGAIADKDYANICFSNYLFLWSLLLALPLQCIAGVAFWRLWVRAARYAGNSARISGWAALLVFGNFGSGMGVWWAGYLDSVHEAGMSVAVAFVVAAVGQLISGVALLVINWKVRQYFVQQTHHAVAEANAVGATQLGRGHERRVTLSEGIPNTL